MLLHCLLLSQHLRCADYLKDTLTQALLVALPGVAASIPDLVKFVPEASTICRSRLWIDVAMCRYMSRFFKSAPRLERVTLGLQADGELASMLCAKHFRYLLTDASPQGGKEWLMTEYTFVAAAGVEAMSDAVNTLSLADAEAGRAALEEANRCVLASVDQHFMPPAGLGKLAMSLLHKCNAILHQVKLETDSEAALRDFLMSIVSFTTDQGIELSLGELPQLDLTHIFNGKMLDIQFDDGGQDIDVDDSERAAAQHLGSEKLFPYTLVVIGMLHIVNNLVEEVCRAMPSWKWFVGLLRPLSQFLHSLDAKTRFVETCVLGSEQEQFAWLLDRPYQQLYLGRWGSIVGVLKDILDTEVVLRKSWSKDKYLQGSSSHRDGRSHAGVAADEARAGAEAEEMDRDSIDKADLAMVSSKFWATAHMIYCICCGADTLASWCEGCPCHEEAVNQPTRWMREAKYRQIAGAAASQHRPCPVKGCRAPGVACGDHLATFDKIYTMEALCIMGSTSSSNLAPEDRDSILKEMNIARSVLHQSFSQKAYFWQQIPHLLCGLAHHDPAKARVTAQDCCKQFDMAPVGHLHHRLSTVFLHPGGALREYVEALAGGGDLSSMPKFVQVAVQRFKLVNVVERRVEADHAKLMRHILRARRFGGVLCLRELAVARAPASRARKPAHPQGSDPGSAVDEPAPMRCLEVSRLALAPLRDQRRT